MSDNSGNNTIDMSIIIPANDVDSKCGKSGKKEAKNLSMLLHRWFLGNGDADNSFFQKMLEEIEGEVSLDSEDSHEEEDLDEDDYEEDQE